MIAPHRSVVTALILLSVVLTDCDPPPGSNPTPTPVWCHADFGSLLPQGWVLISPPIALDTDGDLETECVVFYRYDTDKSTNNINTVGGVVYRRDHGGPPRWIYPCPLDPSPGYHLGEHTVSARAEDVLSGTKGLELIVEDRNQAGTIVQATVFGWRDSRKNDLATPPNPKEMYYKLLGLFQSEGGLEVRHDSVIVTSTLAMKGIHSQLAYHKTYTPTANNTTYCLNNSTDGTCNQADSKETEVVALTECKDPRTSCYPEQTVLDFYRNVTRDNTVLEGLMMLDALDRLNARKLAYGCPIGRDQLDRVLIQDLQVGGTDDKPEVTVKVKCRLLNGKSNESQVTWTLQKYDGKWRLKNSG